MEDELISKVYYKKAPLGERHIFKTPMYIESMEQFYPLFDVCEQAHQDELIQVDIMCYGGSLDVSMAIYNALQSTPAMVTTVNKGNASSGGSIILLAGDRIELENLSTIMIHTSHYGKYYDVEPEQYEQAVFHKKHLTECYKHIYKDFLSEKELDEVILRGTPMYFTAEEAGPRLEKMFEARQREVEDYYKQVQPPSREQLMKLSKKEILNRLLGEEDDD